MQLQPIPRMQRRPKKRTPFISIFFILVLLIALALGAYVLWDKYSPSTERLAPNLGAIDKPIFYQGQLLETGALNQGEALRLPLSIIEQYVDSKIKYEDASRSVIITTENRVVRMQTDQLTAMVNDRPMELRFPVERTEDLTIYLPIHPLLEFYEISIRESEETGAVFLTKAGDIIQWGRTIAITDRPERTLSLRSEPSIKAPILVDLPQNEEVMIWAEQDGWYTIQLSNGYSGYMEKKWVTLDRIEVVPIKQAPTAYVPWKPLGQKINLTWEMVTVRSPDPANIPAMPGLNVISPTWFELMDGEGNIKNLASSTYVEWAHEQNFQVWALFSNKTDPNLTSSALSTYDRRLKMIKQLIAYAQMYKLQGINVDFEYMYLKDKENLVQFMRELAPYMREQGLVVSIDVTPKSNSEMWSMFYDRPALSEVVDYMIIMGYDQHGGGSKVAGSVGTIPWVETAIKRIIEEDQVPPDKLVLAVPFYTRIWTEEIVSGQTKVSSKAVFMNSTNSIIQEKNLTPRYQPETGQNYVEYTEDGKVNKIWLEDEVSMTARLELIEKYNLAGVASWRRGYETPPVWELIKKTLEKNP